MSTPKKHHFVPQFLLRGFTDEKGFLVVHALEPATEYKSTVGGTGHQNDGHTLYLRDGTGDRLTLEREMSQIEANAGRSITLAASLFIARPGRRDESTWRGRSTPT